jgi:hypothetical protein
MLYEQTITVPENYRFTLEVPHAIPAGTLVIAEKSSTPVTDWLSGLLSRAGDISAEEIREERLRERLT